MGDAQPLGDPSLELAGERAVGEHARVVGRPEAGDDVVEVRPQRPGDPAWNP